MDKQTRLKAFKVVLDPTAAQAAALARHAGAARVAYNYHLGCKVAAHQVWRQAVAEATYATGPDREFIVVDPIEAEQLARKAVRVKVPSYMDSIKVFKKVECYAWYPDVNLYALTSGMQAADSAWRNWLDSLSGGRAGRKVGYPRWKKKGRSRDSFALFHDKKKPTLRPDGYRRLNLPAKVGGSIRVHGNLRQLSKLIRRGGAVISSVTISRHGNRWHASILVEMRVDPPVTTKAQRAAGTVGVDWGVSRLATCSNGDVVENPRHLRHAEKRLAKAQRALSRAGWYRASDGMLLHDVTSRVPRRPTAGRRKAQAQVAKVHAQIAQARTAYLHQVTKRLTSGWAKVAIEDLNVAGMTSRAKPVPLGDGSFAANGARSKSGLSRSILDAAPGEFRRQLAYKTSWYGSDLVVVDRWEPTSKTCSNCGCVKPKLSLSTRIYRCARCGLVLDRDVNAARNIAAAAQRSTTVACDTRETPTTAGGRSMSSSEGVGKRRRSPGSDTFGPEVLKPEGRLGGHPARSNPAAFPPSA